MEVTHYRGCVQAIQRDSNITSVRSSETWVPLKCFTSSITASEIEPALPESERESAATRRSHPYGSLLALSASEIPSV